MFWCRRLCHVVLCCGWCKQSLVRSGKVGLGCAGFGVAELCWAALCCPGLWWSLALLGWVRVGCVVV